MGWQKTLPAVRAVWLLVAAQAIVAAVAADVGRTNEGLQPFTEELLLFLRAFASISYPGEASSVPMRRTNMR